MCCFGSIREKNREAIIPPVIQQTVVYLKEKGETNTTAAEIHSADSDTFNPDSIKAKKKNCLALLMALTLE